MLDVDYECHSTINNEMSIQLECCKNQSIQLFHITTLGENESGNIFMFSQKNFKLFTISGEALSNY